MSYDPMVCAADCHTGGLVAYFVTLVLYRHFVGA